MTLLWRLAPGKWNQGTTNTPTRIQGFKAPLTWSCLSLGMCMHQRLSQPLRWMDALQHMRHFYQMTHLTSNSCRSLMFMDARCTSTCHKTHNHLDEWMLSSTWDTSTRWYISHRIVVAHSCSTQAFRSKEIIFLYINYSLAHNFKFWSKFTQLDSMEQDSKSLTWTRVKKYIHMNS